MLDSKNIELKIKDGAKEALEKKIKPGQVVLLDHEDPDFSIKIKNNMDLDMYTSDKELAFLEDGLVLNARDAVLSLSSNEGIIDGGVTISEFKGEKLSADEMKKLGGKIC